MSGGYVNPQGQWEHQVIIITIKGEFTQAEADAWNAKMDELKATLGNKRVTAVTMTGGQTQKGHGGRGKT
jgi:hypothetical protein